MAEKHGKGLTKAGPDRKWPIGVGVAFAISGAGLYGWLLATRWLNLPHWGALGDAVAPIAGLANAFALGAAIWSVQMQRQELHDNREVMREQAKHAEASAVAQQKLIQVQQATAELQMRANQIANLANKINLNLQAAETNRAIADLHIQQARVNVHDANASAAVREALLEAEGFAQHNLAVLKELMDAAVVIK